MAINGGMTFRGAIDYNKKKIIEYLNKVGGKGYTTDIERWYGGERGMPTVRKALIELRKEGKVTTDDKVSMWRGKKWEIKETH